MDPLRKGIAIGMLFGSGSGNLMEKTVTENGVYTAAEEIDPETGEIFDPPKDGYSVFTVDLPLDHKSVTITTSNITSSSGGIFNYDPHSETPELEGYDYFSVNLSGVKDDIEGMQAQIAALEDELEACHDCKDEVVAFIQQYIPDYDPEPDECPADELPELVEVIEESVQPALGAKFITANGTYLPASDNLDGYNQVVVDVAGAACIARIASYLGLSGDYDCDDILDAIKGIEGYPIPPDVDVDDFTELVGMTDDVLEEQPYNIEIIVYVGESRTDPGWSVFSVTIKLSDGTEDQLFSYSFSPGGNYYIECTKIDINDNGILTAYGTFMHWSGEVRPVSYSTNREYLQGWESTNHTYTIKKQR